MAYKGGSKPQKAEVAPFKSIYKDTFEAGYDSPFGSATSQLLPKVMVNPSGKTINGQELSTTLNLSPELQGINTTATTGLQNNLSFLQQDPNQRVGYLTSGQDPLYNALTTQQDLTLQNNLGRAQLQAQKTGGLNSTALGSAQSGLLANDGIVRNQNLLTALNSANDNARQDSQVNQGVIGNLAQLLYPLGSAANSNLMTALNQTDQGRFQTAAAENAANQQYANAMNAYNQSQSGAMSSGIGSLVGAGLGAALAIPTGGLSLAGGAMLGSALGGTAGGLIGGGSGGGGAFNTGSLYNNGYGGGYQGKITTNVLASPQFSLLNPNMQSSQYLQAIQ